MVDHVPEVMRYYIPEGGESTIISMYRNEVHDEADQQVYSLIESSTESIDVMHVDFTMPLHCVLNHFFNICTFDEAYPYMKNLIDVVEERGVKVRALVGVIPVQGIENTVAIDLFKRELEERGLNDMVEIRYFNGLVHAKSMLIDGEYLIVGSQNLHSSAFGKEVGLTEYSFGVVDPQAAEDYRRMFDFYWEQVER